MAALADDAAMPPPPPPPSRAAAEPGAHPSDPFSAPPHPPPGPGEDRGTQGAGVPAQPPPYGPPEWSDLPGVPFTLETLKGGVSLGSLDVSGRAFWTFGRAPGCDVVLEHPSSSRLHAVLQFRPGAAFVFDAGSTHGTYLNKRRLKPRVHAPLRVGDQLRFGESSRLYILCGPEELKPEEGLSKAERAQLRALEAAAARAEEAALRAMALVKARAAAEGTGGGGATWGMDLSEAADHAEAAEGIDPEALDWRSYTGKLSDKQEKAREKLRRKEATIRNLQAEIERITAKEGAQQGLTPGQAAQVQKNEERIAQHTAELEAAEEEFMEQLREVKEAREKGQKVKTAKGATNKRGADEDEDGGDSDSDEFFDRARKRPRGNAPPGAPPGAKPVETAASLWAKREEARAAAARAEEAAAAAKKHPLLCAPSAPGQGPEDELDAYMDANAIDMARAAVRVAEEEAQRCRAEEARLSRLLALADPDGTYKGPRPVAPGAQPPTQAHGAQQKKEEQKAAAAAIAASVLRAPPEREVAPQNAQSLAPADAPAASPGSGAPPPGADEDGFMAPSALRAQFSSGASVKTLESQLAAGSSGPQAGGLLLVRKPRAPATAPAPEMGAGAGRRVLDAAAAAEADVQRLLGIYRPEEVEEDNTLPGEEAWAAPAEQKGDGRTRLNDKYGY